MCATAKPLLSPYFAQKYTVAHSYFYEIIASGGFRWQRNHLMAALMTTIKIGDRELTRKVFNNN